MQRRQTIATTYGAEIARLAERIDKRPELTLIIVEGRGTPAVVPIGLGPLVVGADSAADLVLEDERASGRHAEVVVEDGAVRVRDLGSTNGILVQGALTRDAVIGIGQAFVIGRTALCVVPRSRPASVPPSAATKFGELVGKSLAMRELFAVLELVALSEATLLVLGATGTGKELVARSVHDASPRRKGPFVAIDCGALPENLIESALFGHVRGAFTGAADHRQGAFVRADAGTLFLDEIGNLSHAAQARLLRVLESRTIQPVGADRERAVDVRVIAAAPPNLEDRVRSGQFRADLYYRIAVVEVRLPPLAERLDDLPLLVTELLQRRGFATTLGPADDEALLRLRGRAWPGNVRELRNVIERALALSPGARHFHELRLDVSEDAPSAGLIVKTDGTWPEARDALLAEAERRYLAELVARHPDNISAQARVAGVDRKTLRAMLERHGLTKEPPEPR